jgi:hypothetical protein
MPGMNCWEFKKSRRDPGGIKVSEFGECPASIEKRTDGINNGVKGGRACWAIAGTFCGGELQGSYAIKLSNCMECGFFQLVQNEEGRNLKGEAEILKILRV